VTLRRPLAGAVLAAVSVTAPGRAADPPDAMLFLEVADPPTLGTVPAAAPRRFVLLADGQVFAGGTSQVASGRLSKEEVKLLEDRVALVRKLPGIGSSISFGEPATPRYRLHVGKGKPLDLVMTGDPAKAPAGLAPLVSLVQDLAAFSHPSLRPYEPAHYAVSAQEGTLAGGCRPWTLPLTPGDVVAGARSIEAQAAIGWPTGATPAAVCAGEKRYVVALRPLLPGEKP
jgi:hypothetical protein